jgi:transcriptional regulator with PAS, ATPase and Fis domain
VIEPLGGIEPVSVDVRIVAATHRPLAKLVRKGVFRKDLFYRINVVRIELPPLRDRREDIPLLIEHFVSKFNRLHGKDILGVSHEVLARLMEYDYPGNVRELENIIEHAFVLCRGNLIEIGHLPPSVRGEQHVGESVPKRGWTLKEMERCLIQDALRRHQGHRAATARELGIHPSTLFRKMRSLGIRWPEPQ